MDKNLNAAYLLIDYAWQILKLNQNDVWDESNYGGLVPIVPLSEEPYIEEYSGPHIVYGYSEEATQDNYAMNIGAVAFAVYDDNFRRLTQTLTNLRVAFERMDESARDINQFTSKYLDGAYLNIRFGHTRVDFVEGGSPEGLGGGGPETSEGGRQSGIVSVSYSYFQESDVITSIP